MDLPTYTNIWRIEKRLYKLYDFRLPMPLPINWIAVFAGITIPYIVLLIAIGLPFNHTLVWLYVLPPGVLTWLTTRPVIENKRLPELVESQARYLTEPRTWVRLAPLSEKDEIILTARVWSSRRPAKPSATRQAPAERSVPARRPALPAAQPGRQTATVWPEPVLKPTSVFRPETAPAADPAIKGRPPRRQGAQQRPKAQQRVRAQERVRAQDLSRTPAPGQGQGQGQSQGQGPGERQGPGQRQGQSQGKLGLRQGAVRRAPALPPARPLALPGPVVLPELSDQPAHTTPDVVLPAAALLAPMPEPAQAAAATPSTTAASSRPTPASQPETPPQPAAAPPPALTTPALTTSAPATPALTTPALTTPGPATPAPVPAPVMLSAPPAPPVPPSARPRAGVPGSTSLEVSHDAPRRRRFGGKPAQPPAKPGQSAASAPLATPAPSAQPEPSAPATPATPLTPPSDLARDWPVPARPLRPAPSPASDAPAAARLPTESPIEDSPAEADSIAALAPPAAVLPEPLAVTPEPETPAPETPAPETPEPETPAPETPESALPVQPVPSALTAPAATPVPAPVNVPQPPSRLETIHIEAPPSASPRPDPVPFQAQPRPALTTPRLAPAPAPAVRQVTDPKQPVPSIERALSGPSRDRTGTGSWGAKVRVVTGNGATQGPGARDQEAQDRNRARLPLTEPKRILVLGCTSGAGQSVTTLMSGSMLASLREQPVAAVDLHDGTLGRYRAPAAWLEELLAGKPPQPVTPTRPDGLHPTPKPNLARLDVVASHQPPRDGDEIKLAVQLNRHYPLTLLDAGAVGLTRLLKVADQLVVVVPANADAASALADTREWLDNNGHAGLAMQSVTVINGVSRRSLPDVESAEAIARGRSRAIVRVPWDDMLPLAAANPSALRPQTRVAYTALAGVLVAGLAAVPVRKNQ